MHLISLHIIFERRIKRSMISVSYFDREHIQSYFPQSFIVLFLCCLPVLIYFINGNVLFLYCVMPHFYFASRQGREQILLQYVKYFRWSSVRKFSSCFLANYYFSNCTQLRTALRHFHPVLASHHAKVIAPPTRIWRASRKAEAPDTEVRILPSLAFTC